MRLSIGEETHNKIIDYLRNFLKKSKARLVVLISKDGKLVASEGYSEKVNLVALSALVAGMFSATKEVARIVGEKKFSILLQQGEKRHIHINILFEDLMMVVVFDDSSAIGRIRLHAKRTGLALSDLLVADTDQKDVESMHDQQTAFKEYAISLIDKIFLEEYE